MGELAMRTAAESEFTGIGIRSYFDFSPLVFTAITR